MASSSSSITTRQTTQYVFVRLDPILQNLLQLTTKFKQLAEEGESSTSKSSKSSSSASNTNSKKSSSFDEEWIQTISSLIKVIDEDLQKVLKEELGARTSSSTILSYAPSLIVLADYISLPITAIFHIEINDSILGSCQDTDNNKSNLDENNNNNNNNNNKNESTRTKDNQQIIILDDDDEEEEDQIQQRKWNIRRDYLYKLYVTTSKLMKTYLEITSPGSSSSSSSSSSSTLSLNNKHLTNYLIAIANVLPQQQQSSSNNKKQHQQRHEHTMKNVGSSLNDGTDLWISLLDTIQTILDVILSSRRRNSMIIMSTTGENKLLLTKIWNGALVARFVDGVSFLLLPPPPPTRISTFVVTTTKTTKKKENEYIHVQALRTLDRLLAVSMEEEDQGQESSSSSTLIWRSIFPGIFAAIYKRLIQLHRQTSSGYSIDIECQGLDLLSKLFKHTMISKTTTSFPAPSEATTTTTKEQDGPSTNVTTKTSKKPSASTILTQLQNRTAAPTIQTDPSSPPQTLLRSASQDNNHNNEHDKNVDSSSSSSSSPPSQFMPTTSSFTFFQTQVHQKVIAPLSVLMRQSSVSSSPRIRLQLLRFCRILLVDTNEFWTENSIGSSSSSSATTTNTQSGDDSGIGNSIPELSMDLCLTLESDQDEDVSTNARNILDDYRTHVLESNNKWMFDSSQTMFVSKIVDKIERLPTLAQGSKAIELRKELHLITGYLRASGPSNSTSVALSSSFPLRRSLVATMDISLESTGSITAIDDKSPASANLKFRYLNAETLPAAYSLLQMLGISLGYKHGSMVVDGLLADMFESIDTTRQEVTIEWIQRWIGSLVVANRILLGAFETKSDDDVETNNKMKKRRLRILTSLASSILPLLCESALWNLPTQDISPFLPVEFAKTNTQPSTPRLLQANECMLVLMIELVSSFCTLLRVDGDKFWPALLISLAEKAHQLNSALVQNAAYQCLLKIAIIACEPGISDVSIFVSQGLSSLVASMISQLRIPGGIQVLKNDEFDENVLRVSVSLRWVMDMLSKSSNLQNNEKLKQYAAASSLLDLIRSIVARVDRFHLNKRLSNQCILEFNFLYRSSLEYLLVYWGASIEKVYTYQMEQHIEESDQPWLELLSAYRKAPIGFGSSDESPDRSETDLAEDGTSGKKVLTESEISFVSLIISRSCLFLSHNNLNVTIAACESLTDGFRFLAFVSTHYNDPNDESRIIKNSILQQVASSWPAIKARLVTVSDELNSPADLMALLSIQNKSTKINNAALEGDRGKDAPKRVFLAKLFTLIATLCECSGEFMADRFKTDVWKLAVRHLRSNLQGQERTNVTPRLEQLQDSVAGLTATPLKWNVTASERLLVTSILSCIRRVFQQRDCSVALTVVMESVGTILVPYLEHEDQDISSSASQALKSIVSLDYDVLRRPLLILSGRGIPPIPKLKNLHQPSAFLTTDNKTESILVKTHTQVLSNAASKMSEACEDLLQFVDTLPEQKVG